MTCENHLTIYRGDSDEFEVSVKNMSGTPVDLAGAVLVFTVKRDIHDTAAALQVAGSIVVPSTLGKTLFSFQPGHTNLLTPGAYVYDVQVTFPDGRIKTVESGVLEIAADITTSGTVLPPYVAPAQNTGGGWIVIGDVSVPGGAASAKVFDDAPANTIIQSATVSDLDFVLSVRSSFPHVQIDGDDYLLSPHASGGYYFGDIAVTAASAGDITVQAVNPNGILGALDTVAIALAAPPQITSLAFIGGYPGVQTELKAGDTAQVQGTTNSPSVGIQVLNTGAGTLQNISFASTTSFTATINIADRGTSPQSLAAQVRAVDVNGAYGPAVTTSNTRILNNRYPVLTFGSKTYPVGQSALKGSETADIATSISDADTVLFSSPNGDLSITAPTVIAVSKTVTRASGSYNVSTPNLSGVVTRAANGAQTTVSTVVNIANVAPTVSVGVPAARLRSGGNNGTAVQGHTVTVTANQQLQSAPTLVASGGAFGGGFTGGPSVWTRTLQVHDNDVKGAHTFSGLNAVGLSGIVQNTIDSGATYTLGGFVQRSVVFTAFSQSAQIGVPVIDYSKLQAGIFTATNQPALRNAVQGNTSNIANTYTVTALGANPTTVYWNDATAAGSNSGGTAQLNAIEETV